MFRPKKAEEPDALTPFELACAVGAVKPGVDRLTVFFDLPEHLRRQILDAALRRVRRRRACTRV